MRRALCRSALIAGVVAGACAPRAHATLLFPSIHDGVAGARFDVAPARADGELATWRVEVADAELFGVPGLRSSGVRASGRIRPAILGIDVVQVSSPVGAHARAIAEGGFVIRGAWQGVARIGVERLALDGVAAARARVVGLASRADAGRVSVLADAEWVAGAGSDETSLLIASRVRAGAVRIAGSIRIDGDRFAGADLSLCARVCGALDLVVGYDDITESLAAAVVVHRGALEMSAGVSQHPVLGLSHGAGVACAR